MLDVRFVREKLRERELRDGVAREIKVQRRLLYIILRIFLIFFGKDIIFLS